MSNEVSSYKSVILNLLKLSRLPYTLNSYGNIIVKDLDTVLSLLNKIGFKNELTRKLGPYSKPNTKTRISVGKYRAGGFYIRIYLDNFDD